MLKKAASGVLAALPCSRTGSTLRASTTDAPYGTQQAILRPFPRHGSGQDWTDFFDHSRQLPMSVSSWASMGYKKYLTGQDIIPLKREQVTWKIIR